MRNKDEKKAFAERAQKDAELVRRFNSGDEQAFKEIMVTHYPRILTSVRRCLDDVQFDAEDVAQETFIRAYRALKKFRGDSALSTWLYRIALNLARNRYWYYYRRQRQSTFSIEKPLNEGDPRTARDFIATEEESPDCATVTQEFVDAIACCMDELPDHQREILILRNVLNMDYYEISEVFGIPIGTVKSRIARARGALKLIILAKFPGVLSSAA